MILVSTSRSFLVFFAVQRNAKAAGSLPAAFACVCVLSFENGKDAVEELDQPAASGVAGHHDPFGQ